MTDERPAWARDPDVLERVFHAALGKGDTKGVEVALTLMAPVDPHRAQRLLDDLRFGLRVVALFDEVVPAGSAPADGEVKHQ